MSASSVKDSESTAAKGRAADEDAGAGAADRRRPAASRPRRLLFALMTCVIILAVVEAASYAMIAVIPHSAPRRTADIYDEQSTLIRAFLDPSVPHHRTVHSMFGWCNSANFKNSMYSTNSKALRGTREYTPKPGPNVLRVAAFGSSIVECSEVEDANAWPALIEAANPDIEVLNYGVGGYGSDQAYLRYLAEGTDFSPAVVLLCFTSDELGRTVNVYRRFISNAKESPLFKPRFLPTADGKLSLLQSPIRSNAEYEPLLENPSSIVAFGKYDAWYQPSVYENPVYDYSAGVRMLCWAAGQMNRRFLDRDRLVIDRQFNTKSTAFRIQLALFQKFSEAVRANGAMPIIVLLPEKESVASALAGGNKLYDPLLGPLGERGIVYLDAIDAFRNAKDSAPNVASWFAPLGHYSAAGNQVVAAWLPSKIKELVAKVGGARK
jgi:hypothetical protein